MFLGSLQKPFCHMSFKWIFMPFLMVSFIILFLILKETHPQAISFIFPNMLSIIWPLKTVFKTGHGLDYLLDVSSRKEANSRHWCHGMKTVPFLFLHASYQLSSRLLLWLIISIHLHITLPSTPTPSYPAVVI